MLIEGDMTGEEEQGLVRRLASIIESILLVSTIPVKEEKIMKLAGTYEKKTFEEAIALLMKKYGGGSGVLIESIAGGYQFRTNHANQDYVRQFLETRPPRLSRASLETVSIIAYKQPVTRSDVEDIRGVDCQGAIKTLLDRRLIKVVGKKEVPGKPFLFGTTREFLEVFGLENLASLPSVTELSEILGPYGEEGSPVEEKPRNETAGELDGQREDSD